jgi:hypothetical protein
VPRHLEAYFKKQCQRTSLNILSHFTGRPDVVKRWFVLDLDEETICYYPSAKDRSRQQVIHLRDIFEVVKESKRMQESTQRRLNLTSTEKPKGWEHVFEFVVPQRTYRLFSNSHDVKEQWFYALSEYVSYRRQLIAHQNSGLDINRNLQDWTLETVPGNNQGMGDEERLSTYGNWMETQIKGRSLSNRSLND